MTEKFDGETTAQQVLAISRMTPAMMSANILNVLAALFVLYAGGDLTVYSVLWAGSLILLAGYLLAVWWIRRNKRFPKRLRKRTRRRLIWFAVALGVMWSIPGLFFLPGSTGTTQAFWIALAAGMVAAGSFTLYPVPAAALVFSSMVAISYLIGFAFIGDPAYLGFAVVAVVFFYVIAKTVTRHEEIFVSEFRARKLLAEQNATIEDLLEKTRSEAIEQRLKAEARLAQAQKMEAIGQLTGGIAHDFNNLLASIQGNAELLSIEDDADRTLTDPILRATARGAELTRRLLAVARRQSLKPEVVDPERLVQEMLGLLRPVIGKDIEISIDCDEGLWPIYADPGLLENAILNLAINARDAMLDGGMLNIACYNAREQSPNRTDEEGEALTGEHVVIAVSDTGAGMTEETRQRALEPFFTTKEFGRGSGLGLSMVYGFVKQSGGNLVIRTAIGQGTTIEVHLPRADAAEADPAPLADEALTLGSSEKVLLIEDDADVRATLRQMLVKMSYQVVEAQTIAEARERMADAEPDLIVSDIVLPGGESGLDFARELRGTHASARLMLITGYSGDGDDRLRDLPQDVALMRKPFTFAEFAEAIRAVLKKAAR